MSDLSRFGRSIMPIHVLVTVLSYVCMFTALGMGIVGRYVDALVCFSVASVGFLAMLTSREVFRLFDHDITGQPRDLRRRYNPAQRG